MAKRKPKTPSLPVETSLGEDLAHVHTCLRCVEVAAEQERIDTATFDVLVGQLQLGVCLFWAKWRRR